MKKTERANYVILFFQSWIQQCSTFIYIKTRRGNDNGNLFEQLVYAFTEIVNTMILICVAAGLVQYVYYSMYITLCTLQYVHYNNIYIAVCTKA